MRLGSLRWPVQDAATLNSKNKSYNAQDTWNEFGTTLCQNNSQEKLFQCAENKDCNYIFYGIMPLCKTKIVSSQSL